MKAIAVYPKERVVKLIDDYPEPQIVHATDVKVKILEVGICGTDRDICNFAYGLPPEGSEYLVLGHESLGQVSEVGSAVTKFKPGDLVMFVVRRPCPHDYCIACRSGRQDFCYTGDYTERGINKAHGFMTEFVVDEEQYVVPIAKNLLSIGVLTEPLSISEKAMNQMHTMQKRMPWNLTQSVNTQACCAATHHQNAVVLGAGPVGLLGEMILVQQKYNTFVYSYDLPTASRSKIAAEIGATYYSSQQVSASDFALKVKQIDLVYEATGVPEFAYSVLDLLGINGIFAFTGIPRNSDNIMQAIGARMHHLVLKNQVILGSVNAGYADYLSAVADLGHFLNNWPKLMEKLIIRYALTDYSNLLFTTNQNVKNVLKIADPN